MWSTIFQHGARFAVILDGSDLGLRIGEYLQFIHFFFLLARRKPFAMPKRYARRRPSNQFFKVSCLRQLSSFMPMSYLSRASLGKVVLPM